MNALCDVAALEETLANARRALLDCRGPQGHWEGELSSSPLSTATALFALHLWQQGARQPLANDETVSLQIAAGLKWLIASQNADGGWGDTTLSLSNISTTALCWAALSAVPERADFTAATSAAECWLIQVAGGLEPARLAEAISARYGADRTFSVPILTMLALAQRLGSPREAWPLVPQLPFELAVFPHRWFKWLSLPVVSYALPALIAMGNLRHAHCPTRNPAARWTRRIAQSRALQVLTEIQPSSGGFLEATPLTSFVAMSLIGAGQRDHPVVRRGIEFLLQSARDDGSWPIDTNLATWLTTLAIGALSSTAGILSGCERENLSQWLLEQQYRQEHPYTHAPPGGWAWTDLPGGVPDADDTPGALLALHILKDELFAGKGYSHVCGLVPLDQAAAGVHWLLDLQNSDGGVPTFCRGWGKLAFDRSSADLTAHCIRAWSTWRPLLPAALQYRVDGALARAARFLIRGQRSDGAWSPLWFGNQHAAGELNLTYGTSRVLRAGEVYLPSGGDAAIWHRSMSRAAQWLIAAQNADGGWGGAPQTPSSIEETALALDALAGCCRTSAALPSANENIHSSVTRGTAWLVHQTEMGTRFPPTPIGFYFAKLWYFEQLYPLIYTVSALTRLTGALSSREAAGDLA